MTRRFSSLARTLYAYGNDANVTVSERAWRTWGPAFRTALWTVLDAASEDWSGPLDPVAIRRDGGPMTVGLRTKGRDFPSIVLSVEVLTARVPANTRDSADTTRIGISHPLQLRTTCWLAGERIHPVSVDLRSGIAEVEVAYRGAHPTVRRVLMPGVEPTRWRQGFGYADVQVDEVWIEERPGVDAAWHFLPTAVPAIVRLVPSRTAA